MQLLSDTEFAKQFADCALDPVLFTHEGHLRLAWIHIRRDGVDRAIRNIRRQIQKYDSVQGDGTKYHETITVASLYVINHFMQKSSVTTFAGFIQEFPRLRTHFKDILAQHYTIDVCADPRAKSSYLKPDLRAFDS